MGNVYDVGIWVASHFAELMLQPATIQYTTKKFKEFCCTLISQEKWQENYITLSNWF